MIRIPFTDEEIDILKREKTSNPFPLNRRKCEVLYLKAQGYNNKEIERIVGLTHSTITKYLKLYQQGGFDALTTLNYKGQPSQLHRYAEEMKASFEQSPVGTLKEAKARINTITGIALSLPQIRNFLNHYGIKRRKVKQIPDELDLEAQETFKKNACAAY